LAAGNGALSDLDALREDRVGQRLPGPGHVPSGQRPGAYLARIDEAQVETLLEAARSLAAQVAPVVVEHEAAVRGYVPVFIDGTAIEVDGKLSEEARRGYDGTRQYWLHGCSSARCGRAAGCIRVAATWLEAGASNSTATWRRACPKARRCGCARTTPTIAANSSRTAGRGAGTTRSA
ncbi:MAG: hypothetical protein OXB97_09045, partial [Rhodospirillales bacterium]|nr:hypothetical protein [Rhodospirillales bacterium]